LRVLHVDTAAGWRGGQNQVLLTARGMARLGHPVLIAARAGGALEARARAEGLEVRGLPFRGDLWPPAVLALSGLLREFRPEVAQLHDPHAISAGLAAGKLGRSCPAVATRRVDFALRGRLSLMKYRGCARVIAVSSAIADVLQRDGLPVDRVRVVHEGVPDRPPVPGGEAALRELGVPPGAPVIGCVAALVEHKDPLNLVEAAALLRPRAPQARVLLIGDGELRGAVEARVRERGLSDYLLLPGFRSDLDRLLPALSIFCLSSRMEGLGTSLLDAMAFARPIVATAAGGIPDAVEHGLTGLLVPPADPAALAAALAELIEDAARRDQLGRAGRARFEAHFSDARMVEETLRVLSEVA
jgi:glycosyltransferase involved in cell wall biosynthesis